MALRPKAKRSTAKSGRARRLRRSPAQGKRVDILAPQRNGIASTRDAVRSLSDAEARDLAHRCRDAALEKKAENVLMLDISSRAAFADYFVLATGRSIIQARAIADGVVEANELKWGAPLRTEGYNDGSWILVDYGAVIVHVFTPQAREFYNLERLWGKQPTKKSRF
jgi:ribosome-associated protein